MDSKYSKRKRPSDYLPEEPFTAIKESCFHYDAEHVLWELNLWLCISPSHEGSTYDELKERARFIEFYLYFLIFIEAVYIYYKQKMPNEEPLREPEEAHQFLCLTKEQKSEPTTAIKEFCTSYPILYVRLELWDFFQAVQFYHGPLKESIYQYDTSCLHMHMLTLIEAFYFIVDLRPN